MVLFVNLTFALSLPFHELHVRSMQIYERLIMHVQTEQDFTYPVERKTRKSFFKYKTSKQIAFCLQSSVIVTSRKSRSLHATWKVKRHFEAIIFSLLQIVFHRPVVKILYPWCAIYWHTFPHIQPQPGFFLEATERTLGTRLAHSKTSWRHNHVYILSCKRASRPISARVLC